MGTRGTPHHVSPISAFRRASCQGGGVPVDVKFWVGAGVTFACLALAFCGARILTPNVLPLSVSKPLAYALLLGGPFLGGPMGLQLTGFHGLVLVAALIAFTLGTITAHYK